MHWFDHRGDWPKAACGAELGPKSHYTLWMARVTCPACVKVLDHYIEGLGVRAKTKIGPVFEQVVGEFDDRDGTKKEAKSPSARRALDSAGETLSDLPA